MTKYSVVIPVYNEEKNISDTLKKVDLFFSSLKESFEIIVIDDGSFDKVNPIVTSLGKKNKNIKLLSHYPNQGKGFSVREGVLVAKGEIILFTDADLSTPLSSFNDFLPQFKKGADIVIGTRRQRNSKILVSQPPLRQFLNYFFRRIVFLLVPLKNITDTTCGFKAFTKEAAKDIFSRQTINRWGFDVEILFLAQLLGYKISEIPVSWSNRRKSRVRLISAPLTTLKELATIRLRKWRGKYLTAQE